MDNQHQERDQVPTKFLQEDTGANVVSGGGGLFVWLAMFGEPVMVLAKDDRSEVGGASFRQLDNRVLALAHATRSTIWAM